MVQEITRLSEVRAITVDIDGLLLGPEINGFKTNSWLQFTRRLYLKAGNTEHLANQAVESHKSSYGTFHSAKESLDTDFQAERISTDEYNKALQLHYSSLVASLMNLWNQSGNPLTKKVIKDVIKEIIDEDILNSESNALVDLLKVLHDEAGIPVFILTGGISALAEELSDEAGFDGGEGNSLFRFGNANDARKWSEIGDDEILAGLGYDPNLSNNKIKRLNTIVQKVSRPVGNEVDLDRVLSLVDGDGADSLLAQFTYLLALNPRNRDVILHAKQVVNTLPEMIEAIWNRLPVSYLQFRRENI